VERRKGGKRLTAWKVVPVSRLGVPGGRDQRKRLMAFKGLEYGGSGDVATAFHAAKGRTSMAWRRSCACVLLNHFDRGA
jgi:hypothetical protein